VRQEKLISRLVITLTASLNLQGCIYQFNPNNQHRYCHRAQRKSHLKKGGFHFKVL